MEFYLLDVKSVVAVNGKAVPFDYINTYYDLNKVIEEAKKLSIKTGIIDISIHKWILNEDGTQKHCDDSNSVYRIKVEKNNEVK